MKVSFGWSNCLTVLRVFLFLGLLVPALPPGQLCAATQGARVVKYSKQDIVPIHSKLRFSTLIVLPEDEEILDFTTGDKDFWIVNGAHNLCYIHPAQAGIRSNLNLITSSGHVYSFLLSEVSNEPGTEPDLKVFVERTDDSASAASSLRGYVRSEEVEAYRKEVDQLQQETAEKVREAQAQASSEIDRFRSSYSARLQFDYTLDPKASREPFLVSAIYHDDQFTFIHCAAREKPVLYELKDGKPNLINFQVENGVYIAPKIIDAGYLAVGKKKLPFVRRTSVN